jgi:hypothetical protein
MFRAFRRSVPDFPIAFAVVIEVDASRVKCGKCQIVTYQIGFNNHQSHRFPRPDRFVRIAGKYFSETGNSFGVKPLILFFQFRIRRIRRTPKK